MKPAIVPVAAAIALTLGWWSIASAATVPGGSDRDYAQIRPSPGGTPGYSVGSGVAHVGDGSDPSYYTPGFSGGTGAARIGDGSDPGYLDTQRYLQSAPGRGGGNG